MNWDHFRTVLWMRWRLSLNQWRRLGMVNYVLMCFFAISGLIGSLAAWLASWIGGILLLPRVSAELYLGIWDVAVAAFLFYWLIQLLTEIQRSELLSLEKLLHLPLALNGVFLLNYLNSLVSIGLIMFLGGAAGFTLASTYHRGVKMLLLFPLAAAFVLLVTSLSFYAREWLATMMNKPRTRRALVVGITLTIVLLAQLPNLVVQISLRQGNNQRREIDQEIDGRVAELKRTTVDPENPDAISKALDALQAERQVRKAEHLAQQTQGWYRRLKQVNALVPLLWLPAGAHELYQHPPRWTWAYLAGMGVMSAGFLTLSYRSMIHQVTGRDRGWIWFRGTGFRRTGLSSARIGPVISPGLLGRVLPGIHPQTQTALLGNLACLWRAPETKLAILIPLCAMGSLVLVIALQPIKEVSVWLSAWTSVGLIGTVSFFSMILCANVFGMDRDGFRAYMLMPIERYRLLIGKNLSVVPLILVVDLIGMLVIALLWPAEYYHLVASLLQIPSQFCLICVIGNLTSTFFPLRLSSSHGRPQDLNLVAGLVHGLASLWSFLLAIPAVAGLAAEFYLRTRHAWNIPLYLIVSLLECWAALYVYRQVIVTQGHYLQQREPKIIQQLSQSGE